MTRLLLGSGGLSTDARKARWREGLDAFLGDDVPEVLFVPHAIEDHDRYLEVMAEHRLAGDRAIRGLHQEADPRGALASAAAIYVGGGNTFRLLAAAQAGGWLDPIRDAVAGGTPYVGISAGTNLACPTIQTTNDMPIVWPRTPDALGLVPFQVNAHYFAGAFHYEGEGGDGLRPYGGETRDVRIREFHEANDRPVVGLWEGGWLEVVDGAATLHAAGARIFRRGQDPEDVPAGRPLVI